MVHPAPKVRGEYLLVSVVPLCVLSAPLESLPFGTKGASHKARQTPCLGTPSKLWPKSCPCLRSGRFLQPPAYPCAAAALPCQSVRSCRKGRQESLVTCSERTPVNTRLNFTCDRERLRWRCCKPRIQFVRAHLQRNRLIGAATEKAPHVSGCESWQSQFFVLKDMNQFMKKHPVGERLLRNHSVDERDCSHECE